MSGLERLLVLFLAAVALAAAARRAGAPYPAFLALGGAMLALVPGGPRFTLPPELALALFVAPVLLDAAYDASPRDLKDNWLPVGSLVVFAVGLTTVAVAVVARALVPDMPWAPAVVLGAVVAPPDAAAATAVLRPLNPPHRLLTILEGESLLNDASALLIYRLAVGAAAAGTFALADVAPTFLLAVAGSLVAGPALGWVAIRFLAPVQHVPTAIILQFVSTFGVWILAERLHLSGVLTMVCYAMTVARSAPERIPARTRIPTYAVWETAIFALNILAFIFIGLQIRPISRARPADLGRTSPCRGGCGHGHRRADRLVHVVQRRHPMAGSPVRLSPAASDVAADGGQRAGDLLGRHARHRLAGGGAGAAAGVSLPRSHRADRVLGRAGHAGRPGPDAQAADARAGPARRRSGGPRSRAARERALRTGLAALDGDGRRSRGRCGRSSPRTWWSAARQPTAATVACHAHRPAPAALDAARRAVLTMREMTRSATMRFTRSKRSSTGWRWRQAARSGRRMIGGAFFQPQFARPVPTW